MLACTKFAGNLNGLRSACGNPPHCAGYNYKGIGITSNMAKVLKLKLRCNAIIFLTAQKLLLYVELFLFCKEQNSLQISFLCFSFQVKFIISSATRQ